ncbi:hypothetical protein KBB06_03160 [Candidatus Gracilibacteria bacterium]|nr:hypothetical protein [Candidatus Gracilibacteria bacterium]
MNTPSTPEPPGPRQSGERSISNFPRLAVLPPANNSANNSVAGKNISSTQSAAKQEIADVISLEDRRTGSTQPPSAEHHSSAIGSLRPSQLDNAEGTVTSYQTEFLDMLYIRLANLQNFHVRHDQLKKNPLFNDFRYALYLACRDGQDTRKFSAEEIALYNEFESILKGWSTFLRSLCDAMMVWHNKLYGLRSELARNDRDPELQDLISDKLASLENNSFGKITWQIRPENVELFQEFIKANVSEK